MNGALRQLPDEPGFHRSKEQVPVLGTLSGSRYIVQDPFYLGSREISVDYQSCFFPEGIRKALLL